MTYGLLFCLFILVLLIWVIISESIAEYTIRKLMKNKPLVFTRHDKDRESAYNIGAIFTFSLMFISIFVYAIILNWNVRI